LRACRREGSSTWTWRSERSSDRWLSTTAFIGPLGLKEKFRKLTYRRTEEVVYLEYGVQGFGLRPADGGVYRHYEVGIEHLAFEVDDRAEVDEAYQRCVSVGGRIQSPPEEHYVDDGEDYYAFFAFDPDGIRIEVFCWPSSPYR
jgi:catechol 2,3-dioxygenase-like lactoylglutathione lyase family enzyme